MQLQQLQTTSVTSIAYVDFKCYIQGMDAFIIYLFHTRKQHSGLFIEHMTITLQLTRSFKFSYHKYTGSMIIYFWGMNCYGFVLFFAFCLLI